ncbi:MAG: hypothetical protein AABY28_02275 [Candidatus Omnitrophota bacterium]
MKTKKILILLCGSFLSLTGRIYAKEITILYTGTTHAMLYTCSCPIESDGGIARRATLIKELREKYPDSLLFDSGSFFAGGLFDEYTLNTQADMQRTNANLKAMELMKYDALGISPDEFNFGEQFFRENISKTNLNFLSCNIQADKVLPYLIKDVSGTKIGIIGVTGVLAKQKAAGIHIVDPQPAVKAAVSDLKNKGVSVVIILSSLSENENLGLINNVAGIDILIEGYGRIKEELATKINNTFILKPSWQGRKLGRVTFSTKDNLITGQTAEQLRLSDKVSDDPLILQMLPKCFSDNNCKKEGAIGLCENPGILISRCIYEKANKIPLLVITSRDCITCNTEITVNSLKKQFPGLIASYIYFPEDRAWDMVKDFAISGLPAYLLGREIEKEKNFEIVKQNLDSRKDYYLLKPQVSGFSYFVNRKKIKGKLDLFISLYDKDTHQVLEAIREFNPEVHFLAVQTQDKFDTPHGNLEAEEDFRAVCVQEYHPEAFWDYISCRSKNINSSWWEDCLGNFEAGKIKTCARSQEAAGLLNKNTGLNKELQVMFGPTYLLDNQEAFSSKGATAKEELRKIIKR